MAEIFFAEQKNGYDKVQVDSYIGMLTEAYQKAYKEYLDICDKYNDLLQAYKKLEAEKQVEVNTAITRTLMDSERLAQEIIDNAYNEESRIIEQTKKNVEYAYKTIGQAMSEAQKFLAFRNIKELGGVSNGIEVIT